MTIKKIHILPLFILIITGLVLTTNQALALTPLDTYYGHQWYLKRTNALQAWDKVKQTDKVVVAVIDSGVQINHPDLKNNIWINPREIPGNNKDDDNNGYIDDVNGWDFVNNTADPSPKFDPDYTEDGITHGTLVAGIIAGQGNNNEGIAGIAWHTKIMPLKVMTDGGQGSTFKIIKAIDYAIANGADIINLSFVGSEYNKSLDLAIKRAYDAGVLIVAAGGNEEGGGFGNFLDKNPLYPVCHDGSKAENRVIGVAATDPLDQKINFSGYGNCIDIAAPGMSIFGTSFYAPNQSKVLDKYYDGYWSGTSLAVPIISGTLALIKQANPKLTNQEVQEVLLTTTDNINLLNPQFINKLGVGRVNIDAAITVAQAKLGEKKYGIITNFQTEKEIKSKTASSKIMNTNGQILNELPNLTENNFTSGDLNGDGIFEIIFISKINNQTTLQILDRQGRFLKSFSINSEFNPGSLAIGDVNHDGLGEIIIGANTNNKPEVKIFNQTGKLLVSWLAYGANFKGGVSVAVGDLNQDKIAEIITAPMSQGGAHIRVFNQNGRILQQFFAYDKNIRGSFKVAVGNVLFNTKQEGTNIIVASGKGMSPYLRIFNAEGTLKRKFAVYSTKFVNGFNLGVADMNHDGLDEIIVGSGPGGNSEIKIFKGTGQVVNTFNLNSEKTMSGIFLAPILLK